MLRQLLTCLALLTGFAANGLPTGAHAADAVAERLEAEAGGMATAASAVPARALPHEPEVSPRGETPSSLEPAGDAGAAGPATLIGIDRARE